MFSKPTMSAAVGELEKYGLLAPIGINRGSVGRTSVTYGLGANAGFIVGIDCGTTHVRAIACGVDGTKMDEVEQSVEQSSVDGRFTAIEAVVASLLDLVGTGASPLRGIAIALPNIISPTLRRLPDRDDFVDVMERLKSRYGVPLLVENNVNCAALAEYHDGAAKDHTFAIYMQIGVKVGVGIVIDGRLFRGFTGGAGEVGHIPFPWSPHEQPKWQQVETYLGSAALLERVVQTWPASDGPPPVTAADLFSRIDQSDVARALIERHAQDIGSLASACVSILDPQLIVLGGGVGQNAVLLPAVARVVEDLCWPVEIVASTLSNRGTVLGAARLAIDFAMASLLGEDRRASFLYPGTPEQKALDA
jgi:predicted NBD/HSP70 family sugar kinase